MKDISKKSWDYCKGEKYAVQYLENEGYEVTIKHRTITRDVILAEKDGISTEIRLPLGDRKIDYKAYMEMTVGMIEAIRDFNKKIGG